MTYLCTFFAPFSLHIFLKATSVRIPLCMAVSLFLFFLSSFPCRSPSPLPFLSLSFFFFPLLSFSPLPSPSLPSPLLLPPPLSFSPLPSPPPHGWPCSQAQKGGGGGGGERPWFQPFMHVRNHASAYYRYTSVHLWCLYCYTVRRFFMVAMACTELTGLCASSNGFEALNASCELPWSQLTRRNHYIWYNHCKR